MAATRGRAALHDAAQAGKLDEMRALIDGGADLEAVEDVYRFTPFLFALEFSEPEAAMLLLERGASTAGPIGVRGLALAARGGAVEVIDVLLARGITARGTFALHAAAKYGHADAIERLLKAGAPVDEREPNDQWTPLLIACMENKLAAARVLLAAGASVTVKDDDGNMPLLWAVFGARPNEIHEYPALGGPHDTHFVPQRDAPLVELLLKRGAPIDALDGDGDTALHRATMYQATAAIDVLLARGANRRIKNRDRLTALDLATKRGYDAIARRLRH
jgi:ankyrin repeat protein